MTEKTVEVLDMLSALMLGLSPSIAYHSRSKAIKDSLSSGTQPSFGPDNENLIMMLRKPALTHPHSLSAQLEFLRTRWSGVLGSLLFRLLRSQDLIKEEEKRDTLKEALNMIGGQMLALLDKDGTFRLGIPQFLSESEISPSGLKGDFLLISTGQHRLAVGIVLDLG